MFYDENWMKKNPMGNPMLDDWFIWSLNEENTGSWDVCIKCYINMAEMIANNLRDNIGSSNNIYNMLGFLFSIRQALELSLKRLCNIKHLKITTNHDMIQKFNNIKKLYEWEEYGLNENIINRAIKFMQDKNEIFRYPYSRSQIQYANTAIHLSDWLFLVHALYNMIIEEKGEKNNEIK